MAERVYLSIGSNIGDRAARLNDALRDLNNADNIRVDRVSPVYETQPWGLLDQENFYNIAVSITTDLDPEALLSVLHDIETGLHRVRHEHWGPRTIDLDIIYWGLQEIHTRDLEVPHPRASERNFVLRPIRDIAVDDPDIFNIVDRALATGGDDSWIKKLGEVTLHYD